MTPRATGSGRVRLVRAAGSRASNSAAAKVTASRPIAVIGPSAAARVPPSAGPARPITVYVLMLVGQAIRSSLDRVELLPVPDPVEGTRGTPLAGPARSRTKPTWRSRAAARSSLLPACGWWRAADRVDYQDALQRVRHHAKGARTAWRDRLGDPVRSQPSPVRRQQVHNLPERLARVGVGRSTLVGVEAGFAGSSAIVLSHFCSG